jgi:ABC-type polysaccharide transport system permease subunit
MAFKTFQPRLGVWGSPWAGLYNFQRLFSSPNFSKILWNTVYLNVYGLIAGFPFPIILAICINHSFLRRFKKITQSVTFAPFFLSTVLLVGLVVQFLGLRSGAFNVLLSSLGLSQIDFMGSSKLFPHIYVWSGIWQGTGYGAIIYISALAGVDPTMHEAGKACIKGDHEESDAGSKITQLNAVVFSGHHIPDCLFCYHGPCLCNSILSPGFLCGIFPQFRRRN